jgi:integrase
MYMMNNFADEFTSFLNFVKVGPAAKSLYRKYLSIFVEYLEEQTGQSRKDINLNNFYVLKDSVGRFLGHSPIDGEFLDNYFYVNRIQSYNWLRSMRSALGSFFKYLYKVHNFPNPVRQMDFKVNDYARPITRRKPFSRHEILRLLHSIVSHSDNLRQDLLLFTTLISTGCRPGEIINIRVEQIKLDDYLFLDKTKTKVQRMVPLRISVGKLLSQYCELQNLKDSDYVFTNKKGNKLTNQELNNLLKHFLSLVNVEPRSAHCFRHSFATHMYEAGSELLVIQQLLGHANLQTTETYVHPNYIRNFDMNIPENDELYSSISNKISEFLSK